MAAGSASPALAVLMTVEEILFDATSDPGTDVSKLSGTVDMTFDGVDKLTITLTNTSAAGASTDAASLLLTGVGFDMGTATIASGTVKMATEFDEINFALAAGDRDVSREWGYTQPPTQDPFFNLLQVDSVDTAIGSLLGTSKDGANSGQFATGSIAPPDHLNGPDFGLLNMTNYTVGDAGGLPAIKNSVIMELMLGGTIPSTLLADIQAGHVALSFGSPSASNSEEPPPGGPPPPRIPEPGTMLMFAFGLLSIMFIRRRRLCRV